MAELLKFIEGVRWLVESRKSIEVSDANYYRDLLYRSNAFHELRLSLVANNAREWAKGVNNKSAPQIVRDLLIFDAYDIGGDQEVDAALARAKRKPLINISRVWVLPGARLLHKDFISDYWCVYNNSPLESEWRDRTVEQVGFSRKDLIWCARNGGSLPAISVGK